MEKKICARGSVETFTTESSNQTQRHFMRNKPTCCGQCAKPIMVETRIKEKSIPHENSPKPKPEQINLKHGKIRIQIKNAENVIVHEHDGGIKIFISRAD